MEFGSESKQVSHKTTTTRQGNDVRIKITYARLLRRREQRYFMLLKDKITNLQTISRSSQMWTCLLLCIFHKMQLMNAGIKFQYLFQPKKCVF